MSGATCKICFKIYCDQVPPRILHCGHSCCSHCLTQILETSKLCPICRKTLMFSNATQYLINYSLLEICEEYANSPNCVKQLRQRLELSREKHRKILSSAGSIVSNVLTNQFKVTLMKSNETKLIELVSNNDKDLNIKEANTALDDIEKLMNEVAKIFSCDLNSNDNIAFSITQFNTKRDFLLKVYNEIRNGKELVARKVINDEEKFANISIHESTIYIHALRATSGVIHGTFVEFDDLKDAFLEDQLRVFFDFVSTTSGLQKRIFVECFSNSIFIIFFLKMCTGESGVSYVGCSLEGTEPCKRTVKNFHTQPQENEKYLEYLSKRQIDCFDCLKDKTYVSYCSNGSLDIFQSDRNVINVIGRVVSRTAMNCVFSDVGFNNVFDCGIAYTL